MRSGQTKLARRRRGNPPLLIPLDRDGTIPLFRQIYSAIRIAILSGRVAGGTRLPATRALASDLSVARTTVVLAFERLITEGFIYGRGAAGTFVSELEFPRASSRQQIVREPQVPPASRTRLATSGATTSHPFRVGEPALELFPTATWKRLYSRHARSSASELLGYGDANGYEPLRRAIAEYTAASRGVRATPDQVILNRGAQQAIDLVARVLLQPGDKVWFEDPGYPAARRLFELGGAVTVPVPLDRDGLLVEAGIRQAPTARLAYVAPSHQFPLGSTMPLERRLALLDWAARANSWIIEDDYDSEFRYPGHPVSSLQGLDHTDRVIYVGTFSKTVFPALRLGYLIVPRELIRQFVTMRLVVDHLSPTVEQAALADFIDEGHFTRHIRRMRVAYGGRQQALLDGAQREMAEVLTVEPADAGMHAIAWLRPGLDDQWASRRAQERNIEAPALSSYCQRATLPPALLLGFANVPQEAILPALRRLRSALRR